MAYNSRPVCLLYDLINRQDVVEPWRRSTNKNFIINSCANQSGRWMISSLQTKIMKQKCRRCLFIYLFILNYSNSERCFDDWKTGPECVERTARQPPHLDRPSWRKSVPIRSLCQRRQSCTWRYSSYFVKTGRTSKAWPLLPSDLISFHSIQLKMDLHILFVVLLND